MPTTYYRPQRSWAKVMFLQASVILSTRGGSVSVHAGMPPPQEQTPPEQTPPGTRPPRSRSPLGPHPPGPDPPHPPGTRNPPTREHNPSGKQTPAYGQWAAGTHPTGMHSCSVNICICVIRQEWIQNSSSRMDSELLILCICVASPLVQCKTLTVTLTLMQTQPLRVNKALLYFVATQYVPFRHWNTKSLLLCRFLFTNSKRKLWIHGIAWLEDEDVIFELTFLSERTGVREDLCTT